MLCIPGLSLNFQPYIKKRKNKSNRHDFERQKGLAKRATEFLGPVVHTIVTTE